MRLVVLTNIGLITQNHSARVLFDSIIKSTIQAVLVLSGILSTGRDTINDSEGKTINAPFQMSENSSDWRGERSQTQNTVLANHCIQKLLVSQNKLLISLV